MTKTTATNGFTVEGQGAGVLTRTKANTREIAWTEARLCMVDTFHTVKVLLGGVVVFRAFRQTDGSWIDAKTAKTVKPAGIACAPMALGCKVSGVYHGESFTGTVQGFDGSGYVHVALDVAIPDVYGSSRDSLCFAPSERYLLVVTARAPEGLTIKQLPSDCIGGSFISSPSTGRR